MTRLLLLATAALVATSACAKNIDVNWKVGVREPLRRTRRVTILLLRCYGCYPTLNSSWCC